MSRTRKSDPARSEQMQKAFDIVERMEHVHTSPDPVAPSPRTAPPDERSGTGTESFSLKVSVAHPSCGDATGLPGSTDSTPPVIEVKFTIPSFVWKVPVLGDVAKKIITRLARDQG
ncbi:MAG TPA: hypothetical protein PLU54_13785 [Deltaproteobacteria bacterium]|nr:hypothetical protein [Deltaproteobacteria bacterium]